jgi:GNAT superfamily N-acetyltransferase/DNA-binding MarR family transcriptional regulator
MNFYEKTGQVAIGSRLRLLTDIITEDAARIYKLYDVDLEPKWFPVFVCITAGPKSITAIAREISHSHPSVSKIVAGMVAKKIVTEKKDPDDGRRNLVGLSARGLAIARKLEQQSNDVNAAVAALNASTTNNLWKAIGEWEYLLEQQSLLKRVVTQKKIRESRDVRIVPYKPKFAAAFRALNIEWISKYFKMESTDFKSLDQPDNYILKPGGKIVVALYKDEPVGVCALIKMNDGDYDFELAKMAVSPAAQGKNIGWLLGTSIIELARSLGATKLYLESNTILAPAINLYHKLGFRKVAGRHTPYERCNIQMELLLEQPVNEVSSDKPGNAE